ncbi:MAG: TROVE domain-containing protein [Halieaceae bacterium]|jgi:60 kDa SS-A/Ro ribonucleoprotein|nr:TROVE domain-containing protein [Halieaceae bacterium]
MGRYNLAATQRTPQTERTRSDQVENNAGGFVFETDPWAQLDRFLILGAKGGTYYVGASQHLTDNLDRLKAVIALDGKRAVERIAQISEENRAVNNEAALVALAVATADPTKETRKLAWEALPRVARIGTHLFHFVDYRNSLAGWGRLATRGVSAWYEKRSPAELALQMLKYQQRDGWSHRDVLRVAHPRAVTDHHAAMYDAACGRTPDKPLPPLYDAVRLAAEGEIEEAIARGATREMLPTEAMGKARTWELLFRKGLPATAFLRNLANLTRLGVLSDHELLTEACDRLEDPQFPAKGRIHPYQALVALKAYQSGGRAARSQKTFTPLTPVVGALERLLANSWSAVKPTGKRFLIGLDVSGSMWGTGGKLENGLILPGEAGAAVLLAIAKAERFCQVMAFSRTFQKLDITRESSFSDALARTRGLKFSTTDCALPVLYATRNKLVVDVFLTITDNETYAGSVHPYQALQDYRKEFNPNARMIVLGMTATRFTIADPKDPLSLDIAGMDASVPKIITEFASS